MQKIITILSWVLFLLPAVTLADRPAMSERSQEPEPPMTEGI